MPVVNAASIAGCRFVPILVRSPLFYQSPGARQSAFHEADFWQHPRTFEHLRKGDCEDHALWAWRKLVEMGYRADLYVGEWPPDDDSDGHHAWVVFERDDQRFVLEAIHKSLDVMVRPLGTAPSPGRLGLRPGHGHGRRPQHIVADAVAGADGADDDAVLVR